MRISTNDWTNYIGKLRKLSNTAADKMQQYVQKNGFANTDELIEHAYALATKYGEGSAELACQMYDAVAEMSDAAVEAAVPAATATYAETARAVQGSLLQSPTGQKLTQIADRLVKQAAADTIVHNAIRDRAQWAWIPSGDSCAFCITLASRGWQYASKSVLKGDHAQHIHANCDCMFQIRFDSKTNVAGYDPEKLREEYYAADGNSSKAKINSLRRANYAANADKIRAQKRAAYASRKNYLENETSRKRIKALEQSTLVDLDVVNSNEYRQKLDSLIPDTSERRAVEQASKEIFDHRTGTHYEDLAYINTRNGKTIINKDFDFYDEERHISACKPNKAMTQMLNEEEEYTIIGVHNHPGSSAPSTSDLSNARDRKYKYGVVACHDGTVYKFKVSPDYNDDFNANIALDDLQESFYNGDKEQLTKSIQRLKELGVEIEVV